MRTMRRKARPAATIFYFGVGSLVQFKWCGAMGGAAVFGACFALATRLLFLTLQAILFHCSGISFCGRGKSVTALAKASVP